MKKTILLFFSICCMLCAKADHITGGEMYYTCTGFSNNEYQYHVTLKLFMRCNSGRQFADPTIISIFDRVTGSRIMDVSASLSSQETISGKSNSPCITDPPLICYVVGYFYADISLPASLNGYTLSTQVNFRITGINNFGPYEEVGATYTTEIPGTQPTISDAPNNTAAQFTGGDLVTVCAGNSFSYDFSATDKDGDELRYSFCNAYAGGNGSPGSISLPASAPPYTSVPYGMPDFSGAVPLGNNVQINSTTGLITGIAPDDGKYVVTVCVQEVRSGIVIATQRKDLQINIASCTIASASLQSLYMLCHNTKTIILENNSTSSLIKSYDWKISNSQGNIIFNSTDPTPGFTFPDTGQYFMKLTVNKNDLCSDSATAPVNVYPGLVPNFISTGICINNPTIFTDASTSIYGKIASWKWDFGEQLGTSDFSAATDPAYTYSTEGDKNVRLIVTDSKGCIDTLLKDITIVDKPPITMAFRDSLICITDKVQLQASGTGNFTWTPAVNIVDAGTPTPVVSPVVTTTYFANLNTDGCKNTDSVTIRVVDHVNIQAMADTTICSADSIQIRIVSDGLSYSWTPSSQLKNPFVSNPEAITATTTLYEVTASIGSCIAKGQVRVTAVPYPDVRAGADTVLCFNTSAQLNGNTDGSSFLWTPSNSLSNPTILNPIAKPLITTTYILESFNTKGCPKPGFDTVIVKMLPAINAYAGHDTTIVTNQPLQLNATGGTRYVWTPASNLSDANIANPVAIFTESNAGLLYKVFVYNEANCVDSASIRVKAYRTLPSVFVPNAFTPNGDGKNDFLRPIAVGIQRMEYFKVFNRWGQLVFNNTDSETVGWDGRFAGKQQAADAYVWVVKAIDYNGNVYSQKGVVLLIR